MGQPIRARQRRGWAGNARCALLLVVLCVACSGGSPPTATPPPATITLPTAASMISATSAIPLAGGVSEGVHETGADAWQAAGITGKGVKVGIIDTGFVDYAPLLGSATVTARSFRDDELIADSPASADTVHGTACAEIVHEMAPDAALYLAATDTTGSFLAAMQWLTTDAHVSIITTSLGFYGDYPTDGSSDLARAVDKAKAAGVFFVKSAGNLATMHYGATFTDTDNDGFHDFSGGATKDSMAVRLTADPFEIFLNWADWQRPHVNYDLFLMNSAGQEMARSDTDQARTGKRPVEHIMGSLPAGTYMLKIKKANARDPDLPLMLIIRGGTPELATPDGSITVPGDARGAVAVAAINVQTEHVESFSSHGPTLDGRAKPEMGAPDNVQSRAYGAVGVTAFLGTSAAAPHLGGAAALYKQVMPNATPDAILAFLTQHAASPQGTERGTNITGNGRLALGAPPRGSATPRPAPAVAAAPVRTPPHASRLFTDDFSSPASGLPPQGYVTNGYRVTADASAVTTLAYPAPLPATDSIYEVQARTTSGAADTVMGLVVRRADERDALLFVITNDGAFNILTKVDGSMRSLTDGWQPSTAIAKGGVNSLRVEVVGTTGTFSVNGQNLSHVILSDNAMSATFGILAGGGRRAGGEVTFMGYTVTAP